MYNQQNNYQYQGGNQGFKPQYNQGQGNAGYQNKG